MELLRRYTDIPSLLAVLKNSEITLLSPSAWDDRNDRHLMEAYARTKGLKTLLALCFSEAAETYHHWRVFAPGNSGVCIEFHKELLLNALPGTGTSHSLVDYKTIKQIQGPIPHPERLPFTKRSAFADEQEYRVVFESKRTTLQTKRIPVPLSTIRRVVVNPWVPKALYEAIESTIYALPGCSKMAVYRSKLIDSPAWKQFAGEYA